MYLVARSRQATNRSVDIFGLSTEFERHYLSEIMPGFSVLSTRFAYFGFICWVIAKGIDPKSDEFRLLEYALAKTEYSAGSKGYRGIRNINSRSVPPYYVQSIFGDYRNTLIQIGALKRDNSLTAHGMKCAGLFEQKKSSHLRRVPADLDAASREGFPGIGKSLLKLTSREKAMYREIFFYGIDGDMEAKSRANKRKMHKRLYEKLSRRLKAEQEGGDTMNINVIDDLGRETSGAAKYALAHEMSKYLDVSYYCAKALHELHRQLKIAAGQKMSIADAAENKQIRKPLDMIMAFRKQRWINEGARAKKLRGLCRGNNRAELLRGLIKRNIEEKEEKSWIVRTGDNEIRINPGNPPVPVKVPSFGIRLAPFKSLTADLKEPHA